MPPHGKILKKGPETCRVLHDFYTAKKFFSFLQTKLLQSSLHMKRFSKYMFLKIEIFLIPLLEIRHIFDISEEALDFANAFLSFPFLSFPRVLIIAGRN
jgi:hypothetical protein